MALPDTPNCNGTKDTTQRGMTLAVNPNRAQGEVSVPFNATIAATGGLGPYTWAVTAGTLPPGLTLTNGAITGTPTTAGGYAFVASVTDA